MGFYISLQDVKIRLTGKVSFDETGQDENKMSYQLANQLINQAEGDVEMDLSPRYAAPFQTTDGLPFANLPARPTKQVIRTLCLNKACLYILGTDFGRGSAVDGDEYAKGLIIAYNSLLKRCVSQQDDEFGKWKYPPMPGLRLGDYNAASDDGYAGQIYVTGSNEGGYAATAVTDPGHTFWNPSDDECADQFGESFRP